MKFWIALLFLTITLPGIAQKYSSIKGKVYNDKLKTVTLYKTVDGALQKYAESQVSEEGYYGFMFVPETSGFWSVGDKYMNFIFYLKGGEEVNLDLLETKAELNGKNTKENKVLYEWEDYAANIRLKSVFWQKTTSNYEDFFPEFETFIAGKEEVKKKLKSGNEEFDILLQKLADYETDFYATKFLATPRTKHPERSMWPDYYNHIISDKKFTNDEVLIFPNGIRMMDSYLGFAYRLSPDKDNKYNDICFRYLHNDRLKGEFVLDRIFVRYKTYEDYLKGMEEYGKYLVTNSLKQRAEAIGSKLYETRTGGNAADFTYPDVNGKMVSLSDFKGKVVLVDVWATWCGPCRAEIPHLKKLEEEMHGKDIVFLGVSVDEEKDKQKWLDFIEKEDLKGIQLFANGWSKITKDYKINGIPRFMVFDKKGNIVSVKAPRPSSPELKQMLEAELAK